MSGARSIPRARYIKLIITSLILVLFSAWTGWYILLPLLAVVADYYLFRLFPWRILRFRKKLPDVLRELYDWISSILIAVILVLFIRTLFIEAYSIPTPSMERSLMVGDYLFVSKISYGPKLPNTLLSFPFTHNTMPFSGYRRSYSEKIILPYQRLKGIRPVKHNDVVVFHFPEGDTVVVQFPEQDYYQLIRQYGRRTIHSQYDLITRPIDKRDNFVKRCVALPGDTLEIRHSRIYVNNRLLEDSPNTQHNYYINMVQKGIDTGAIEQIGRNLYELLSGQDQKSYVLPLTGQMADKLRALEVIKTVTRLENSNRELSYLSFFPYDRDYPWTEDNFGPLIIPEKGTSVRISTENLALYSRIIRAYEGNKLEIRNNDILINDFPAKTYTFKMNYYFMIGDNRHNSADSRVWGFVPEDHIVGRAVFVWLSIDKEKESFNKIRWDKMFKVIR